MPALPDEVIQETGKAHDNLDGAVVRLARHGHTCETRAAVAEARWRLVRAYTAMFTQHGEAIPDWQYRVFCDAADGQPAAARETERCTQPAGDNTPDEDDDFDPTEGKLNEKHEAR
jgi:hypothetical protein